MKIIIGQNKNETGYLAAETGANIIRKTISEKGSANIIVATGASQLEMLSNLVKFNDIRWDKVNAFHLDEYIGLDICHPASFRIYLWQRFVSLLPLPLKSFYFLDASENPKKAVYEANKVIEEYPIDLAFIGIGENGHIAFNDPPADFETEAPYIIVNLDHACRMQQLGEGWFKSLDEVPKQAISMSVKKVLQSRNIICTVPEKRKAEAVYNTIHKEISPNYPSTILRQHKNLTLFLDTNSASKLNTHIS